MNYDEAKATVLAMPEHEVLSFHVARLAVRERAAAGFVVWDGTTPAGRDRQLHLHSFLEAVFTGLAFVQGATRRVCQREWMVAGKVAHIVLRTLPRFEESDKVVKCPGGFYYSGKLGRICVYVTEDLPSAEFMVGDVNNDVDPAQCVCRGLIQNYTAAFNDVQPEQDEVAAARVPRREPRVPAGNPMWRALQGAVDVDDQIYNQEQIPYDPNHVNTEEIEEPPEFQKLNEGRIPL